MARDPSFWTPERDAEIIALRKDGLPAKEIARQVGASYDAVRIRFSKLHAAGVKLPATGLGRPLGATDEVSQTEEEIAAEQAAMEGLDDAAVVAFARARDAGQSIPAARMDALAHMRRRLALEAAE